MQPLYNWFGGRSSCFAWAMFVIGSILAFLGRLTPAYAAMLSALCAFVVARAVSQDHCEPK